MEYITRMLGVEVVRADWKQADKLPYFLLNEYHFEAVSIGGTQCLFLKPVGDLNSISVIRKQLLRLREVCEWPVVFELPAISRQRRTSFVEARIAFVAVGKQLYLPFIGTQLQDRSDNEPVVTPVLQKLQPSAQMLLFAFILGMNKPIYLSDMTKRFGFSAMSMSRAADQLAQTGLIKKKREGVQLVLASDMTPQSLYQKSKSYLKNPVRKTVYIKKAEINSEMFHAGLSALADKSMLNFPMLEVWGTAQPENKFLHAEKRMIDEEKQYALELWKYDPRLTCGDGQIDALSLAESLKDSSDERVEQMIEDMLTEVW